MIYFTADTHFGHETILKMEHRPFESVHDMDEAMIKNWNEVVTPEDDVYHLGDFAWKHQRQYSERLNGKVTLIRGNHDHSNVSKTGWKVADEFRGFIEGQYFHLYHYPLLQWDRSHYGSIHLYGHVHGMLKWMPFRGIDVGQDVWDFKPVSLPQIIAANSSKNLTGERYMNAKTQRKY